MFKKIYFAIIFRFTNWTFNFWQSIGLHVVPNHFYQPIPDTRHLPDSLWSGKSEMVGVDLNEVNQLALLDEFERLYKTEYSQFPVNKVNSTPPHTHINITRIIHFSGLSTRRYSTV